EDHEHHHAPDSVIAILPFEFGHVPEIHAIDAYDEGEGNKNCGNNGKHTDDFIQFIVHRVNVNVQQPRCKVFVGIEGIDQVDYVVIHVCEKPAVLFSEEIRLSPGQFTQGVTERVKSLPQIDKLLFQRLYFLKR